MPLALAASGEASASSIHTAPDMAAGTGVSIVRLGDAETRVIITAPDSLEISPSVIASDPDAYEAAAAAETDDASEPVAWRAEAFPTIMRGGLTGDPFAVSTSAEADTPASGD